MQPSNGDQNCKPHNRVWYLLTEYSLSEFLADHDKDSDLMTESLFQEMRALGMPPENLESIDLMLKEFIKEALLQFKPGSPELPVRIRVFGQQKMIDVANSAQTARRYATGQVIGPEQKVHTSGTKMNGGWGCFLLKRGGNVSEDASPDSHYFVDLYLYKEG